MITDLYRDADDVDLREPGSARVRYLVQLAAACPADGAMWEFPTWKWERHPAVVALSEALLEAGFPWLSLDVRVARGQVTFLALAKDEADLVVLETLAKGFAAVPGHNTTLSAERGAGPFLRVLP